MSDPNELNDLLESLPPPTEAQQRASAIIKEALTAMATHEHGYCMGDLIRFEEERQRYTIRAISTRYLICTKPFNVRRTTVYTIVDFVRGVRGRENLIFGMGFETEEQIARAMDRLMSGESEVSYRHCVPLRMRP